MHPFPIYEHFVEHNIASSVIEASVTQGIKEASELIAKKGAAVAAKSIAEDIAKKLGTQLLEGSSKNVVKQIEKAFGEQLGKAAGLAAKNAFENQTKILKQLAKQSKTIVTDGAEQTVKEGTEKIVQQQAKTAFQKFTGNAAEFTQKFAKYAPILGASAGIATLAINAQKNADRINSTSYTITSIKPNATRTKTIITFTPTDSFTVQDTVTISGSNSQPSIDGSFPVEPVSPGIIIIPATIQSPGTAGQLKCFTTLGAQAATNVGTTVASVGKTAGQVAGDIGGGFFSGLLGADYKTPMLISFIVCVVLFFFCFLFMLMIKS
jgi:hypothetical protein